MLWSSEKRMWLIWLAGCSLLAKQDVAQTVQAANTAMEDGDLAAFERLVDVDNVIPEVANTCAELQLARHADDAPFRRTSALEALGKEVGLALIAETMDQPQTRADLADDFRRRFPHLPDQACPALFAESAKPTVAIIDDTHATVSLPLTLDDFSSAWVLDLTKTDDWRITGVRGNVLRRDYARHQQAKAKGRARELVAELSDGGDPADWQALRAYVANQPDDLDVVEGHEALMVPLLQATPPVTIEDAKFHRPPGLFRVRQAVVGVNNPTRQTASEVRLRVTMEDAYGNVANGAASDHLAQSLSNLSPGATQWASSPAGAMAWPGASAVRAQVVEVRWADGSSWTHPAAAAGAW
jgi:hypothetical protein